MNELNYISLIIMSLFYFFAGVSHFKNPVFFLKITPKWVIYPKTVNIIVGIIEILLAVGLLFQNTRFISASLIIALLILVFPANIRHSMISLNKKKNIGLTIMRLPLQGVLIYWAYSFI